MSSKTTNFNLHKIDLTDAPPDITVLNQNWDIIDGLTAEDFGACSDDHKHSAGDITSGILSVSRGGTGTNSNPSVKVNLSSTTAASMFASEPRPGVTGTLPVTNGGTGATSFSSGAALIGAGNGAITTRTIQNNLYNTDAISGSTSLVNMNTLKNALNRTTGPCTADANYSTPMMRAIKAGTTDLTAGTSELTSGTIYLVYE